MDLRKIKQLLSLMEAHKLAEIEIAEENGNKVRLRKDSDPPREMPPTLALAPAGAAPQAAPAGESGEDALPAGLVEIKSPMVGTFYRSAAPEADPFVAEGDEVEEETVVCIIEAMKVMNEIKSEVAGEIVELLAENGEAVEYGQPLMRVKPKNG